MLKTLNANSKLVKTALGQYWRSSVPAAELRRRLHACDVTRFKLAALGGEPESDFEQSFASLGYSYLKDKAPRLLDFVVGFQLVDRDEDNTKAMGVFGFKVGEQWLYAPIFFINGDLKGHELLYVKDKKIFVPLKENWVNYLIAKQPHTLGDPSDKNTNQLGGVMPNLMRMAMPPQHGKWATDSVMPQVSDWCVPFLPVIGAVATVSAPMRVKCAEALQVADLRRWLRSLPALKFAHELYQAYPLIKVGFDRFYGLDFFRKQGALLKERQTLLKSAESFILPPEGGSRSRTIKRSKMGRKSMDSLLGDTKEAAAGPVADALLIYTYDGQTIHGGLVRSPLLKSAVNAVDNDVTITENKPELDDAERARLLRDTVLIKDKRDPHATSMVYNVQVPMELLNPSETGLYQVLEKPGKFDEMLVIHNPHSGRGSENFSLVIRKNDPRAWLNAHRTNLWVKAGTEPSKEAFTKYVKGLGRAESLQKGATYVAVDDAGTGTCAFDVREDYGDGTYRVRWEDHVDYNSQRPSTYPHMESPRDWDNDYSSWDAKIHLNRKVGARLRSVRGELSIPADFKIIKIKDPPKPRSDTASSLMCCAPSTSETEDKKKPIQPGNLVDIQFMLYEKTAELRLHDTGAGEVWLHSRRGPERLTKKAALISLVRDHGLREDGARAMLKAAAVDGVRNQAVIYRIKYATSLQPGPDAPTFPQPNMGMEQAGPNSYPAIFPQEDMMPVDSMSSHQTDPSIYDPFYKPDKNMQQVAQQAASSGDKEVFDVSMFKNMLKAVRAGGLFTEDLGDLMRAVNTLGKKYILLLWHHEEAEERYGKHDLPELVDSVRNAFDVLGDVLLFLKEKEVGDADELGSAVGNSSEPSVDEAARN